MSRRFSEENSHPYMRCKLAGHLSNGALQRYRMTDTRCSRGIRGDTRAPSCNRSAAGGFGGPTFLHLFTNSVITHDPHMVFRVTLAYKVGHQDAYFYVFTRNEEKSKDILENVIRFLQCFAFFNVLFNLDQHIQRFQFFGNSLTICWVIVMLYVVGVFVVQLLYCLFYLLNLYCKWYISRSLD